MPHSHTAYSSTISLKKTGHSYKILRSILFLLLTITCSVSPCFAGEEVPPNPNTLLAEGAPLTLGLAIRVALFNNPRPAQALQAILTAESQYEKTKAALYPTVGINGSFSTGKLDYYRHTNTTEQNRTRATQLSLEARYTLYDGFFNKLQTLISRNLLDAEKQSGVDIHRLLIEAVTLSYNNVLLVSKEIKINQKDLTFQENMLRESELKRAADLVTEPHVLNFKIKRNRAQINLLTKKHDLEIQRTILAQIMGQADAFLDHDIELAPFPLQKLTALTLMPTQDCLLAAKQHRPDLLSIEATVEAATYNVKAKKSKYSPTVTLVGNAGLQEDKTSYEQYGNASSGYFQYTGTIQLSWALYDAGSRRYDISAATSDLRKIKQQAQEKWLTIASEVRTSHTQIEKDLALHRITSESITLQEKQRELVTEQFRAGEVELSFLNETQQDLVQLEHELALSEFSILSGLAALESAMGTNTTTNSPLLHTP